MLKNLRKKLKKVNSREEFFNKFFNKFDYFFSFPRKGFTRSNDANFMAKNFLLQKTAGLKILDAGAGDKPYKKYFQNSQYESCDSKKTLSEIKYSSNKKHTFYCDITKKIPKDDETYDIVICNFVFEHIKEPQKAALEIHRVLKKNGKLYLTVPQCHGLHMEPHNYFNFLSYGIKHILVKAGFQKIKITPLGGIYHLLGKILTNSLNLFFNSLNYKFRILFFIFELIIKTIFLLVFIFLYYADNFDKNKKWTIGYSCVAIK